jgi:hypothetical protein
MTGLLQDDVADGGAQAGGLAAFFEPRPRFRRALRGYDRADVDEYVAWAEEELLAVRQGSGPPVRCSGCSEAAPAQVAAPPSTPAAGSEERDAVLLVGAMRELLRLAEERADALVAEAETEAERVRAAARTEAEVRLRNVADLRDAATAAAERVQSGAAAVLERARGQADELLQAAAAERDRLDAEAAQARARAAVEAAERRAGEDEAARRDQQEAFADAGARLAAVAREVEELYRQRDEARESLRRLTGQIGAALEGFAGTVPDDGPIPARRPGGVRVTGNVVLAEPREPVTT